MSKYGVETYERRKKGAQNWTQALSIDTFWKESQDLTHGHGPVRLSINRGSFGPDHTPVEGMDRVQAALRGNPAGMLAVIACNGDKLDPQYAFRKVVVDLKPANTEGSPAIDLIYAAVRDEYGADVYSLGIYVAKPGEHGATGPGWKGNAYDIGVKPVGDSPANRQKLLGIGEWLVAQQKRGLPVGGVISQARWWSPSSHGWQPYHSPTDLHYTHVHTSGFPEAVPGWI